MTKKYQVLGRFPSENSSLPEVTENDNGKIIQVVDGEWKVTTIDEISKSVVDGLLKAESDSEELVFVNVAIEEVTTEEETYNYDII